MLIDKPNFRRCLAGYSLTDCAVRTRDTFYFVAVSEYDTDQPAPADCDRLTRVVVCFAAKPMAERWRLIGYTGFTRLMGTIAQQPLEQFVGVDLDGQVASLGSGIKEHEARIPSGPAGPVRGGIRRLRRIDGLVYASSGYRGLARREAAGQWTSLCDTLAFTPAEQSFPTDYGFDDFDAFSADDIYCAGGHGDLWHRSADGWRQIPFPDDALPCTVCCAGNGHVYIGGQGGSVWRGRGDRWQLIHRDQMTLPFSDMVWFGDRVWCTSDYGLWQIVEDRVIPAEVPDGVKICSGNLDAHAGVLLLAGIYGAACFDGQRWSIVFDVGGLAQRR